MFEIFANMLGTHGYQRAQTFMNNSVLYVRMQGFQAYLILTVEDGMQNSLNEEWLAAMRSYLTDQFAKQNYTQINLLYVIATPRIPFFQKMAARLAPMWLVDAASFRPIIFENQSVNFDGVYPLLVQSLERQAANAQSFRQQDAGFRNYQSGYAGSTDPFQTGYARGASPYQTGYAGSSNPHQTGGARYQNYQAAYGASRSRQFDFRSFVRHQGLCNLSVIAINIVVHLILSAIGSTTDVLFMLNHGAMFPYSVAYEGAYYQLFTSMFLHFGFSHIFNNMLVLFFLGDNLERAVGHWKYLVIYLGGGLAGNLLSLALSLAGSPQNYAVSAGASGAIFAVVGALVYIVMRNRGRLEDLSTSRLLFLVGVTIFHGLTTTGVDNGAHIGGLIGGFVLAILLYRKKRTQ